MRWGGKEQDEERTVQDTVGDLMSLLQPTGE